jgi:hypothetical protein
MNTRKFISDYLQSAYNIVDVRIGLMSCDKWAPRRNIVIDSNIIKNFKNTNEAYLNEIMNSIRWHLPPSRRLVLSFENFDAEFLDILYQDHPKETPTVLH